MKPVKAVATVCNHFKELEFPLLVFPIVATVVVALGFVLKFPCAVWEWWFSVFLTVCLIWWKNADSQRSAVDSILFLACLGVIWILTNITYTPANWDNVIYHQPAIRMMAHGWNPFWHSAAERLPDIVGLPDSSFSVWHVIAMPKGVWYFSAIAYKFTNAHFNLYGFPNLILSAALILTLLDSFKVFGKYVSVLATIAMLFLVGSFDSFFVDRVVAICAIGLLVTMMDGIGSGQWHWTRLLTYTFWLSVAKQTACLHCGVFWAVFLSFMILYKRPVNLIKLTAAGVIALALFVIVNLSPYFTSWKEYGHPFYPKYTVNAEKFPARDLTVDFCMRNSDAQAMGHVGAYLNAFASSSLAQAYYKWKLKRPVFCPNGETWRQQSHSPGSPTTTLFRLVFCASLLILVCLCNIKSIFLAVSLFLGTVALPTEMIGYLRYTPWCLFGCVYCGAVLLSKVCRRVQSAVDVAVLPLVFVWSAYSFALNIDLTFSMYELLRRNLVGVITTPSWADGLSPEKCRFYRNFCSGNIRLLQSQVPELMNTRLVVEYDEKVPNANCLVPCCDGSFMVLKECDMLNYSRRNSYRKTPGKWKRALACPRFVCETFLITLPKSLWRLIYG